MSAPRGFSFNDYCRQHRAGVEPRNGFYPVLPRIVCADGFSMSVQGNYGAYCAPRDSYESGYYEVEVGFPSERVPELMEYAEDASKPTDTVYGYVPVMVVERIVDAHGGVKVQP
jgi:hypothetical protein